MRKRPVTSFLVLAFAISYVLGLPFNFAVSSMFDASSIWALYVPRAVTVFGPAMAAMIVTRAVHGAGGVAHLLRSLRIPLRFLPWALVAVVVGFAVAAGSFFFAGADVPAMVRGSAGLLGLHLIFQVLIVGIGEELGWRGWLLPALATRHRFAVATALTALAWAAWHGPMYLSGLTVALSLATLIVAASVILALLWTMTERSVGIAAVAHAAINTPFFFLEGQARVRGVADDVVTNAFAYSAAAYAAIAIIGVLFRRTR